MELSKQLILFRYILRQFGYEEFETLREEFNNKEVGVSTTGYTFFASYLMNNSEKYVDVGGKDLNPDTTLPIVTDACAIDFF